MTRVLLAIMADPFPSSGTIAARTGLSRPWVHMMIHKLRDEGLVDFVDGQKGTLRPRVKALPVLTGVEDAT
jgi:Mn-dependent DtxR family transcriptional regulator